MPTPAPWCTYFYDKEGHDLATYINAVPDVRYTAQHDFPDNWRLMEGWHRHLHRDLFESFTCDDPPYHLHWPPLLPTAPSTPMLNPGDPQTILRVPTILALQQTTRPTSSEHVYPPKIRKEWIEPLCDQTMEVMIERYDTSLDFKVMVLKSLN